MSVVKVKFPDIESELLLKFKERRSHSRRCSANWIKTKAKQILEEKHSEDVFSASHGWFCRFLKRFNLCPRKRSNTKQDPFGDEFRLSTISLKFQIVFVLGTRFTGPTMGQGDSQNGLRIFRPMLPRRLYS